MELTCIIHRGILIAELLLFILWHQPHATGLCRITMSYDKFFGFSIAFQLHLLHGLWRMGTKASVLA